MLLFSLFSSFFFSFLLFTLPRYLHITRPRVHNFIALVKGKWDGSCQRAFATARVGL